jgi:hypothetical protein
LTVVKIDKSEEDQEVEKLEEKLKFGRTSEEENTWRIAKPLMEGKIGLERSCGARTDRERP